VVEVQSRAHVKIWCCRAEPMWRYGVRTNKERAHTKNKRGKPKRESIQTILSFRNNMGPCSSWLIKFKYLKTIHLPSELAQFRNNLILSQSLCQVHLGSCILSNATILSFRNNTGPCSSW
jgi:hypothetical protein